MSFYGSSSSGSGSSSSGGTKDEHCGQCGGRHHTVQCHIAAPPQGRGGLSRCRSTFPVQQQRLGKPQFRPFQQPGPSRFGQSSHPQFSGPQFSQVNAMTREQAEGTPGGGIIQDQLCIDELGKAIGFWFQPWNSYGALEFGAESVQQLARVIAECWRSALVTSTVVVVFSSRSEISSR
ncbi:hypothetical protein F511_36538 [Dorcoceras hygrometricum]|uniref:Uncharacterized protein n=1 Tax=Dorcoceras hygrometricum TaxID=472368 RepID=A0A2Z7D6N6_9LAMI|nr:hypothetical protein F511_36538 [Dorcoceras hygrometricum]